MMTRCMMVVAMVTIVAMVIVMSDGTSDNKI